MRIDIIGDGCRIYVDIDGLGSVAVDGRLVERPTLLLLHGGPGADHATYKLGMVELRDVAQVVMYDHRGCGRSDWRTSDEWNLDTWADDVVRVCDALEIEKPIVLGNSFGGFVAQRYIGRHPGHPGKVVLSSTACRYDRASVLAMFEQLGGTEAREAAERRGTDLSPESRAEFLRICGPLYTQRPGNIWDSIAMVVNPALPPFWIGGENQTFDLRGDLANAVCPVLVLGGELDPVCPISGSEEIVSHLPSDLVQFERFANCGHGVFRDSPELAMGLLRRFISSP